MINSNSNILNFKSSQIKFGETFAILIVVFFAFIFGAQFYVSSLEDSFEDSKTQRQDTQSLERLEFVLNYEPFLHSSSNNREKKYNLLYIEAFSNLDTRVQNNVFRDSEIILYLYNISFDETSQEVVFNEATIPQIVLFNNTDQFYDDNGDMIANRVLPHSAVINVYDPKTRQTQTGILRVRNFFE